MRKQSGLSRSRSNSLRPKKGAWQHGTILAPLDSMTRLALEASGVIALRMTKLMLGGKRAARREARLMVSEKIDAAAKATASLMGGASAEQIISQYRRRVAANARRLGKMGTGGTAKKSRRRRK
jgi:hypothetical protein